MAETINQPSAAPTRKIAAAAGFGPPTAALIAWVLSLYGLDMPVEIVAALGALLSPVIGYFVREWA